MSEQSIVQYMGFEVKSLSREYTFSVRGPAGALVLEYTVAIANEAFVAHRVRYQDAPDICSLRLHRELASCGDQPCLTHFSVTDAELADYHDARKPKPLRGFPAQREPRKFE